MEFYIAGRKVEEGDPRAEVRRMDNGKHQLVIHDVKIVDEGTVEARCDRSKIVCRKRVSPLADIIVTFAC